MTSVYSAVRDLGRMREIAFVLVRHGFGEILGRMGLGTLAPEKASAGADADRRRIPWWTRVRLVLEDLGPTFIKLGQVASTRADRLPPELVAELKKLQDSVPPVEFAAIGAEIESSLALPLSESFTWFDENPLAAASIGQVHRARLRPSPAQREASTNGAPPVEREVVVKVQRPGVRAVVERDLDLLHVLAAILERSIAEARLIDPVGLVEQFDRAITAELDFTNEASNLVRFRANFDGYPGVAFPEVFKEASSKRVLTTEFFDGKDVYDAVAAGASGRLIARVALGVVIKMIFEDGFFHADPHPGNIIILGPPESPVIGLIDVGMVGRLSPELRDKTIRLMVAAARRDGIAVADAIYAIGRPTGKVDAAAFRAEVSVLAEKYLGRSLRDIQLSGLIRDLIAVATKYGLEIPSDFVLVGKALMTVEGIGKELDPELDVIEEAKPHFLALLRRRLAPRELGSELLRGAERFAGIARDVPMYLQEVLDDLRSGRLAIRTTDTHGAAALDRLGRRLFSGVVVASLNIAAAVVLTSSWHYRVWACAALFLCAWWAWAGHVTKDAVKTWWSKGRRRSVPR